MKIVYAITQKARGPSGHGEPGEDYITLGHDGSWGLGELFPIFEDKGEALKFLAATGKGMWYDITPMQLR